MEPYLSIRKAAAILGVSIATLRNWDASGKLPALRTPTGQRRYTEKQLRECMEPHEQASRTDHR